MVKTRLAVKKRVYHLVNLKDEHTLVPSGNLVHIVSREAKRLPPCRTPNDEQLECCLIKVRNPWQQQSGRDASVVKTVNGKNAEKGNTVNGKKQKMVKTVNGKNAACCVKRGEPYSKPSKRCQPCSRRAASAQNSKVVSET